MCRGVAAGSLVRSVLGPGRFRLFTIRAFAEESPDYSDLANWFSANPSAEPYYDDCNKNMVTAFNNINGGTYSPNDINAIAEPCSLMGGYSQNTGSPTLDTCTQACVMKNVPAALIYEYGGCGSLL